MRVFRAARPLYSVCIRRVLLSSSGPRVPDASPLISSIGHSSVDDEAVSAASRMMTIESDRLEEDYEKFRERVVVAEEHLEQQRFAEAVAVYEDVARTFAPNYYFGEMFLGLGCAFIGLGQHAHAVTVFDRGIAVDADNTHLHMNKGLALVVMGEKKLALATFEAGLRSAKKAKETEDIMQFLVYCGQLCEELGDEVTALSWYNQALQESPEYSQLWYLSGCLLANMGNREEALKRLRTAIDCPTPWPSAYYKLSKMVDDPIEKRKLYAMFLDAQKALADAEQQSLL